VIGAVDSRGEDILLSVVDYRGRRVKLTHRNWHTKILNKHPETQRFFPDDIIRCLTDPIIVTEDRHLWEVRRCFYIKRSSAHDPMTLYLKVVVEYNWRRSEGVIITAYACGGVPSGETPE